LDAECEESHLIIQQKVNCLFKWKRIIADLKAENAKLKKALEKIRDGKQKGSFYEWVVALRRIATKALESEVTE
jgi:hypothetical protein